MPFTDMKIAKNALLACMIVLAGCSPNKKQASEESQASYETIVLATNLPPGHAVLRFAVTGMTCEGCAGGLHSELLAARGVKAAGVSLKASRAVVVCDTNRTGAAQLVKVIKEAGFESKAVLP